jgi:hypothetical protein
MDVNEPLRMFISYSHADKNYLEHFIKHLVSLKRNGIIKEWTDKELIAGDRLDEEIRSNLINSDIVAFLISIDFLNSYYCHTCPLKPGSVGTAMVGRLTLELLHGLLTLRRSIGSRGNEGAERRGRP